MPLKGCKMRHVVVELGAASKRTTDYSGNFAWDNLTYGFKRYRLIW